MVDSHSPTDRTTILITGGTGGIGFEVALALARQGARVAVTGRNEHRGARAVDELRRRAGHSAIHLVLADGRSVRETRGLAAEVTRRFDRLDILVNNVGRVFGERIPTAEGLESTLALNFVVPLDLTCRLLPLLERSGEARIINVVSSAFRMWKGDPLRAPSDDEAWIGIEAHARAKLLALLWTLGLARELRPSGIVANAVNPGMAWTPGTASLTREMVPRWRFIWPVVRWFQRRARADVAARGIVRLASTDSPEGTGRYYDGLKEARLPKRLESPDLQDAVRDHGRSLVEAALRCRP